MKKTTVISLYGPPGSGKSTTAAGVFYYMKLAGCSVELVREYIKMWAWRGWIPTGTDDLYFFGKQSKAESDLYGKVDFVVTDSPVMLAAFYEDKYNPNRELVKPSLDKFLAHSAENGVTRINFWLERTKKYNPSGRYQTEAESDAIGIEMQAWLTKHGVNFAVIDGSILEEDRATFIKDVVVE